MTDELLARIRRRLSDEDAQGPGPAQFARLVRADSALAGDTDVATMVRLVTADVSGFGPLDELLRRPDVTDVLVNAPDDVWIDDGAGLRKVAVAFADEEAVRRTAQRLLASAGRRVDLAHPFIDVQLPGGIRLHVVVPPIAASTVLSLRVPRRRAFTLAQLCAAGSMDTRMAVVLSDLLVARVSFVVSGGTGAGKTTVLAALIGAMAETERIVVIEDTGELAHSHPHAVHLQSRRPNAEGAGAVAMSDLVRQALRMRPDRLVVGEVRGPEVVDLLAALNTGHAGSASTVHANSASDVVARFAAMAAPAGVDGPAVERQLGAGIGAVVHVDRDRSGNRYVAEIAAVTMHQGRVIVEAGLTAVAAGAPSMPGAARSVLDAWTGA
ncbi:MAG: pilus assembly protein CpaF [Frankiaceae bacterium]|nr:pilus assembly protein CpaF [Frankiaceae bacterium]